jgi:Spy/CpxP family protein refolding chaperone
MRSRYLWSLALLLIPLSPALAQRADSTDPRRADSLRHRIEERFASRVQEQLGLTNEQTTKLRATSQTYGTRRRELREREHRLREALSAQLQPGVAANRDSVAKLTDAMIELKLASAQAARDEMKEVSKYLDPVQRARLYVMRERFHHRVKEAHEHRKMGRRQRDRSWM